MLDVSVLLVNFYVATQNIETETNPSGNERLPGWVLYRHDSFLELDALKFVFICSLTRVVSLPNNYSYSFFLRCYVKWFFNTASAFMYFRSFLFFTIDMFFFIVWDLTIEIIEDNRVYNRECKCFVEKY